jgi:hypothetical protein
MKAIWKYPIFIRQEQIIDMPLDAKILTVQLQGDFAVLWALVETNNPIEGRIIVTLMTGESANDLPEDSSYIGTYQKDELVYHIFERLNALD